VRRVSLVADRASPVRLTFSPGKAVIEAQTEGRARAVESVVASFHGEESAIAFNPHYLLDGLTAAASAADAAWEDAGAAAGGEGQGAGSPPGSAWVRLEFTSPAKPALITPAHPAGPSGPDAAATADMADAADTTDGASTPDPAGVPGAPVPAFRYLVVPLRSPTRS
jgi:DNA polymerase III sliding clamp (beta) subunit (PCNA family)